MKKLASVFFAITLLFSTVGAVVFVNDTAVEAKSYKSGKRGFQQPSKYNNNNNYNNNYQQNQNQNKIQQDKTTNSSTWTNTTKNTTGSKGGFMRGLVAGGIAGLLFGSLFSNMGPIGNILGFFVNVVAILLIVYLVLKIYYAMKRKNEAHDQWRR